MSTPERVVPMAWLAWMAMFLMCGWIMFVSRLMAVPPLEMLAFWRIFMVVCLLGISVGL